MALSRTSDLKLEGWSRPCPSSVDSVSLSKLCSSDCWACSHEAEDRFSAVTHKTCTEEAGHPSKSYTTCSCKAQTRSTGRTNSSSSLHTWRCQQDCQQRLLHTGSGQCDEGFLAGECEHAPDVVMRRDRLCQRQPGGGIRHNGPAGLPVLQHCPEPSRAEHGPAHLHSNITSAPAMQLPTSPHHQDSQCHQPTVAVITTTMAS